MRKSVLSCCLLVFLFLTTNASADIKNALLKEKMAKLESELLKKELPNCINVKSFYDKVYCAQKVYSIMDDELNVYYKKVRAKLNSSQKNSLKKVQRKWIKRRDDKCAKVVNSSIMLNLSCSQLMTLESYYYLYQMNESPENFDSLLKEYASER